MHKGAVAKPIPIGQPEALVASDLARLNEKRYVASTPQKLRDSHHMIARLAATGLRGFQIAEKLGYSRVRVNDLLNSPAMEELVANYRAKVDEAFVENADAFFDLATRNMLAAERHISDHIAELDEQGELLPIRTALAVSRDAADRFGYGKKTQNLNINVDFAAKLEAAIARSGKGPVLESTSVAVPRAIPPRTQASTTSHTPSPVVQPQPSIRRRA